MTVYPLHALRTLALHAQGLTPSLEPGVPTDLPVINQTVERMNYVQLDTLTLIQRAHYIALWSRLGSYTTTDFDRLVYHPELRRFFEGVRTVASIIPLSEYRYQLPQTDQRRKQLMRWYESMLNNQAERDVLPMVLERIRQEGALKASDFEYHGQKRGSWWDWKPAKTALEYWHAHGELMVSNRVNFQRVYDLAERVLPDWVNTIPPSLEERDRHWVERGLLAMGVCLPGQEAEYGFHMRYATSKAMREWLLGQGLAVPIQGVLMDGQAHELIVHRAWLEALQAAADGALKPERTTFLSFFDNLFWCRGRDILLWGYRNLLEAYVKEPKRVYGYFCQSILHKGRLVGRFDPKLERKTGVLRLKALYLEPGVQPDEELVVNVAEAMRDFMRFHQANELVIEKSQPTEFGEKLLRAL